MADLQFIMSGVSPLTLDRTSEEGLQHDRSSNALVPELATNFSFLIDSKKRTEMLSSLYQKLEISAVKAKAAYALALHALEANDWQTAERLLYECLYTLDQLEGKICALPPIISELGTQASISFGDVLLANHKYKYAIEAYESALVNLRMRKKYEAQFQSLARKIAMVATTNNDGPRAVQYYLHILDQAKSEGKINEVVHITLVATYLLPPPPFYFRTTKTPLPSLSFFLRLSAIFSRTRATLKRWSPCSLDRWTTSSPGLAIHQALGRSRSTGAFLSSSARPTLPFRIWRRE